MTSSWGGRWRRAVRTSGVADWAWTGRGEVEANSAAAAIMARAGVFHCRARVILSFSLSRKCKAFQIDLQDFAVRAAPVNAD